MQQQAKDAAMMGEDPSPYLEIPTTEDTKPDEPAASELNPSLQSEVKPGTITPQENTGGSIEAPEVKIKPSTDKHKEASDFMNSKMSLLRRGMN